MAAALSAADRQRRHRARQREGVRVYRVSVPDVLIEAMIEAQRLTDDQAQDRDYVALELAALIEERARSLQNIPLRVTPDRPGRR